MAQTSENKTTVLPRRFKILLGLSLALNLAVVGVVAGAFARNGPHGGAHGGAHGGPPKGVRNNFAMPYLKALPREERRALFERARAAHQGNDRAQRGALYQDMIDALEAEVFDRKAVEAVLANQVEATLQVQSNRQLEWINVIEAMSYEDRMTYAAEVKAIIERKPKRKKH